MTRLDALRALLEQVEAGTATMPDMTACYPRTPDGRLITDKWGDGKCMAAYQGSLDAAKALHEAVLPGWRVQSLSQFEAGDWLATISCPQGDNWPKWTAYPTHQGKADDPARSWLLAIIRALIAEAEE